MVFPLLFKEEAILEGGKFMKAEQLIEVSKKNLVKTKPNNKRFENMKKQLSKNWQLYVFLLPVLIFFFIFNYIPMYGVQIAFKDFIAVEGIWGSPWVGFEHFTRFFESYYFWRLLRNTLSLSIYELALFPLPIILALSLNELDNGKFKKWSQTITYAPHFISVVVLIGMVVIFLDPVSGLFNRVIEFFGGEAIHFLTSPRWFRHVYVWSGIWQSLGWSSIIYIAALSGINPELHEAATVDGATRLQRIRYINIPGILPTIVIMLILRIGSFMSVGFEKVLLLQNSLNASTSTVIQTFVYETGLLGGQYSFAAAVGLFDSIINITLLVIFNYLARKTTDNSLW